MISVNMFVADSKKALAYYEIAFGAISSKTAFDSAKGERTAKFYIGPDRFAIADENPAWGSKSPLTLGSAPLCIQLFVNDVEKAANQALTAGGTVAAPGTVEQPIFITPDGTHCCNIIDPFGFIWSISKENRAEE